eukprot:767424-Hanusia_phi.AAC.9
MFLFAPITPSMQAIVMYNTSTFTGCQQLHTLVVEPSKLSSPRHLSSRHSSLSFDPYVHTVSQRHEARFSLLSLTLAAIPQEGASLYLLPLLLLLIMTLFLEARSRHRRCRTRETSDLLRQPQQRSFEEAEQLEGLPSPAQVEIALLLVAVHLTLTLAGREHVERTSKFFYASCKLGRGRGRGEGGRREEGGGGRRACVFNVFILRSTQSGLSQSPALGILRLLTQADTLDTRASPRCRHLLPHLHSSLSPLSPLSPLSSPPPGRHLSVLYRYLQTLFIFSLFLLVFLVFSTPQSPSAR